MLLLCVPALPGGNVPGGGAVPLGQVSTMFPPQAALFVWGWVGGEGRPV